MKVDRVLLVLVVLVAFFYREPILELLRREFTSGSLESPFFLSESDTRKLTGNAKIDASTMWVTLYNGTTLNLTDIDVEVTIPAKNSSRRFRLIAYEPGAKLNESKSSFIKPFSSG
jgi:hypothetical protein